MEKLMVGTHQGVYRYDPGTGEAEQEEGIGSARLLASGPSCTYAVDQYGVLWSRDSATGWQIRNEAPVSEDIWSIGADPNVQDLVYLGVSPAMLYRSADGGRTFQECDSMRRLQGYESWSFPPPPHIPHVRHILADPQRPGGVYIGVEEGGCYFSDDGGECWESLNEGLNWDVHAVSRRIEGFGLFATTGYGFHRSEDAGHTWSLSMNGLDRVYTIPLISSILDPNRLLTAAASTPPPGWRSSGTANAAIYRSDDSGKHWRRLSVGLPSSFEAMVRVMVQDGAGTLYASSGPVIYSSDDQEEWRQAVTLADDVLSLALV